MQEIENNKNNENKENNEKDINYLYKININNSTSYKPTENVIIPNNYDYQSFFQENEN